MTNRKRSSIHVFCESAKICGISGNFMGIFVQKFLTILSAASNTNHNFFLKHVGIYKKNCFFSCFGTFCLQNKGAVSPLAALTPRRQTLVSIFKTNRFTECSAKSPESKKCFYCFKPCHAHLL